MTLNCPTFATARPSLTALALCFVLPVAIAQTAVPKPAKVLKLKKSAVVAKPAAEVVPPPAGADQIEAAGQVFYGVYECEFKQTIHIDPNLKYPSYVNVRHGKSDYLMKPVESSTGAIRLEDVRGETLMVQISSKSMLLNVRTAQRLVDDCVTPKQRELVEAARAAKAEAAVAAAAAASASAAAAASAAASAPNVAAIDPAPTK